MISVTHILLLYAGIVLINVTLSAFLWYKDKLSIHKPLFILWCATLVNFFLNGISQHNNFTLSLGFSGGILIGLALYKLCTSDFNEKIPWLFFIPLQILAYLLSIYAQTQTSSLFWISLPISIGTATPYLAVTYISIKKYWKQMTFSNKGLVITTFILGLHVLDFPFIRESLGFVGFTIACLLVFALSIFGYSMVIEKVAKEKSKVSAEIDVAQKIQMELLPPNPTITGYEIEAYMKPADKVGGDYYDTHKTRDGGWLFVGDVTGHGLAAGLVMFMVQSIISSIITIKKTITPSELNFVANEILFKNLERLDDQRPMTIVTLQFKKEKMIISGSHDNIYILRAKTKKIDILAIDHIPIGIGFMKELTKNMIENETITINKGDLIFIPTDGITEAFKDGDPKKEQFGEDRLLNIIKKKGAGNLVSLKSEVISSLDTFTNFKYYDDVTFVVVKRN